MSKLETNTIDTISGTNTLQVGDGNVATINLGKSGDTINIPSGATITNSGTANNFGGTMTPAFYAYLSGNQTGIANTSHTKIAYNAELYDIGGGFNTSTNTYTIPESGKYYFSFGVRRDNTSGNRYLIEAYKNGSSMQDYETGAGSPYGTSHGNFVREFSANDTIAVYLYQNSGGNSTVRGTARDSWMYGFKIIE